MTTQRPPNLFKILLPLMAIGAALLVGAILMLLAGAHPIAASKQFQILSYVPAKYYMLDCRSR